MRDRGRMSDHVGRVAAVARHPADFVHILTDERIVAAASAAIAARAAEPADAGPRADAPAVDAFADRVDHANHLMAGNARVLDVRKQALHRHHVAVADAASLDANAHFLVPGTGMSRSSASNGPPGFRTTIARIFAIA